MRFYSTNGEVKGVELEQAVLEGLAADGGLFMPDEIGAFPSGFLAEAPSLSFPEIALVTAKSFLGDALDEQVLRDIVEDAVNFDAPLVEVKPGIFSLELFHGPTLAFKDFGARFMARLMAHYVAQRNEELTILVATSGDTGSAVAHGFLNTPGIRVVLLYPSGKVSPLQEQQLTTMGGNISALEVQGTFDDCQTMVKEAFVDEELRSKILMSSANSINIARLVPQSFYYVYSWSRLPDRDKDLVITVPSGNFGNLTAGMIAKRMGLPVTKFVAATNINDVVPEYLKSGVFTPRPSATTISNAMDVGNPSNFYRMCELYSESPASLDQELEGYAYTDEETKECMQAVHQDTGYILDPHGAVGYLGLTEALKQHPDANGIFLETAHPAKFKEIVDDTLNIDVEVPNRLQQYMEREKQSTEIPPTLAALKESILQLLA